MGLRDFLRRAFASGDDDHEHESTRGDGGITRADGDAVASSADGTPPAHPNPAGGPPLPRTTRTPLPRGDDAVRAALRLRLLAVDALPTVEGLPHLRAIAPGVVEVLTVDLPDRAVVPPTEQVARLGTPAELVSLGRDHLRELVGPGLERREIRAEDGLRFCFAHGAEHSTASLALVLPEVLAYLEAPADPRRGVAVAVPDAQHLAYRTIEGLESVMALGPMAAFARNGYDDNAGAISPEVYWARGPRLDQWEQLTRQSAEGIEIHVPAALTALVEED